MLFKEDGHKIKYTQNPADWYFERRKKCWKHLIPFGPKCLIDFSHHRTLWCHQKSWKIMKSEAFSDVRFFIYSEVLGIVVSSWLSDLYVFVLYFLCIVFDHTLPPVSSSFAPLVSCPRLPPRPLALIDPERPRHISAAAVLFVFIAQWATSSFECIVEKWKNITLQPFGGSSTWPRYLAPVARHKLLLPPVAAPRSALKDEEAQGRVWRRR